MAKIIAFANQKGGVGKTTLSVLTASWLAQIERKRVLVVDMDAQGSATNVLLRKTPMTSTRSEQLLDPALKKVQVQTVELTPPLPVYHKRLDPVAYEPATVDLIGSYSGDAQGYEAEALPLNLIGNPAKQIEKLRKNYDYIILDCPPSLGRRLASALVAADYVICPVKLSGMALDGLGNLIRTIIGVKKQLNNKLNLAGIVCNEFIPITSNRNTLKELQEDSTMSKLLFNTKIRQNGPTDMAMTKGIPIWAAPSAYKALEEFQTLIQEIKGRILSV